MVLLSSGPNLHHPPQLARADDFLDDFQLREIQGLKSDRQFDAVFLAGVNHLVGFFQCPAEGLFHVDKTEGIFEEYPLYSRGNRIGTLYWRPFLKKEIAEKEAKFKKRTRDFLIMSFLIAGIGSLLIALLFSQYLSKPVTNLKNAAEKIAKGDFSVRTVSKTHDEVGKLSEVFNRMAESLQKEDQLRKQLMSNIAHELRTPLTIIRGEIEVLLRKDRESEEYQKTLKSVLEESNHMEKIIDDLLLLSRIEASNKIKSTEKILLDEILSEVLLWQKRY